MALGLERVLQVVLQGDVAVRAGATRAGVRLEDAEGWRPWRTYAMHLLWGAG